MADRSEFTPSLDAIRGAHRDAQRLARRRRRYAQRASKLERHRGAIVGLARQGASLGEIRFWLATLASPPITVSRSTIHRWLQRVDPEGS